MEGLVLERDRHLKWRALDRVEHALMLGCGLCLAGFTLSVFFDVLTREIGTPWLWLQEVTSAFFTYGIFCGAAVATRRQDHLQLSALTELMSGRLRTGFETLNRVVVLLIGVFMVVFGWANFLNGLHSFRMPSMTPIAYLYWPIPLCGAFIVLFCTEQIICGLRNGFAGTADGH
jgi:TRAP-type C4-dicarboxylate transport system permease small subunit